MDPAARPLDWIRQLDEFSRRWPLSAFFGAYGYLAVRAVIDGRALAAVIFGLLALLHLSAWVWLLSASEKGRGPTHG